MITRHLRFYLTRTVLVPPTKAETGLAKLFAPKLPKKQLAKRLKTMGKN